MKKKLGLLIVGLSLFTSCSDEPSDDPVTQVQRNMESNSFVIEYAFDETVARIGVEGLDLLAGGDARDTFIKEMWELTDDVFEEVVEDARASAGWGNVLLSDGSVRPTYVFKEYLDLIPVGIEGPNPGSGVLDMFSQYIDQKLNATPTKILKLMTSTRNSPTTDGMPTEYISMNYAKLAQIKNQLEDLIMEFPDPEALEVELQHVLVSTYAVNDAAGDAIVPPLMKLRDNPPNPARENSYRAFTKITTGTLTLSGDASAWAWDQKMRRAALLNAINSLVSTGFQPSDEDHLSLYLQRAMWEAVTVLCWVYYYDNR